jgi:hypothetical protein
MTEVKLRQPRVRCGAIFIAMIMLGVLYFAKIGPQLGRLQDAHDKAREEQKWREIIFKQPLKDIPNLREAFKSSDSVEKLLKELPKASDKSPIPAEASTKVE